MMFSSQPAMRPLPSRLSPLFYRLFFPGLATLCAFGIFGGHGAPPNAPRRASLLPKAEPTQTPQAQPTPQVVPTAAPRVAPLSKPKTATIPAPPAKQNELIRVGLCTKGGDIQVWSRQSLFITDPAQPGLAIQVKAEDKITFVKGAPTQKPIVGQINKFYSGALQIRTSSGTSGAWQSALVYAAPPLPNEFIHLTTDGANPQWGRPYRGMMEIAPMTKPFDASHYKGALRVVNAVAMEEYLKGVVPWEMTPRRAFGSLESAGDLRPLQLVSQNARQAVFALRI